MQRLGGAFAAVIVAIIALPFGALLGTAAFFAARALLQAALGVEDFKALDIFAMGGAIATAGLAFFGVLMNDDKRSMFGSARWATRAETKSLTQSRAGLLLGRRLNGGQLYRYDGVAHLLTLAPTRSGKGVGTIIPNLLTADRSVICIDPKGENARVTGRARRKFGQVYYLDPFGAAGQPSASYNPMASLNPLSLDLAEDAAILADALVVDPPGQVTDIHWNEEAKALLTGIILYAVCHEEPQDRTLATVRDYLTLAPDRFRGLLTLMQESREARGLIARAANRHLAKSDREAAGVLSSAQRHTHFLDSPRILDVTARSDFRLADLKNGTATVFLILPPDRLETYSRWLRLVLAQAINDMARSEAKPPKPVLFLLDEFAALGRLAPVERAMGLMAGYGLQLWPILQDVHQLRAIYKEKAGTFFSNAGAIQTFGVNDHDTAEWLSKTIGKETVEYATANQSSGSSRSSEGNRTVTYNQGTAQHFVGRELLQPDEIMRLKDDEQILLLKGRHPVQARKLRYFEDKEFRGLFDQA